MIFRLMAEQKDEDDHKNWCDMELEKTTYSKEDKEDKSKALKDKIDDAEAKVLELTNQISELEKSVSEVTTYIQEETELRTEAKAENEATIKDAKDAQEAIANANAILKEFYESAGALLQVAPVQVSDLQKAPVKVSDNPDTWESSSSGLQSPDGVLSMLEKIAEDFAEMESETMAQEAMDQQEYDKDMTEKLVQKAAEEKEAEMKGHEKKRLIDKLKSWKGQKKHVDGELEAVVQYLKIFSLRVSQATLRM